MSRAGAPSGRAWGAAVVGSSAHATRDYRAIGGRGPLVVMLGCERGGMSTAQEELCDSVVRIPVEGGVSSLNVAVAAGLLLYEWRARREARRREAQRRHGLSR